MKHLLIVLALSVCTDARAHIVMSSEPALIDDLAIDYPRPLPVQWGRPYRSPYRTYYPGPGHRIPYWGISRPGYWGPRWQRDPWWNYNRWQSPAWPPRF